MKLIIEPVLCENSAHGVRGLAVVELEQAGEPRPALYRACADQRGLGCDALVAHPLMRPFLVIQVDNATPIIPSREEISCSSQTDSFPSGTDRSGVGTASASSNSITGPPRNGVAAALGMLALNRSAIVVRPRLPFLEWLHVVDPTSASLTLTDLGREPTVYLVPECGDPGTEAECLAGVVHTIFENQLDGWWNDRTAWPAPLSLATFKRWFDLPVSLDAARPDG